MGVGVGEELYHTTASLVSINNPILPATASSHFHRNIYEITSSFHLIPLLWKLNYFYSNFIRRILVQCTIHGMAKDSCSLPVIYLIICFHSLNKFPATCFVYSILLNCTVFSWYVQLTYCQPLKSFLSAVMRTILLQIFFFLPKCL
jgi:hypothetical protein